MEEDGHKVVLHVYDLSQGLARQLSATFLGKAIDGIWHTGIVVYGNEYYFGGGIQHSPVAATPYGKPLRVVDLGVTHIPKEVFEEYLVDISPRYTPETYNLFRHNCNNFSNEVSQFLVSTTIPEYIIQLPGEIMDSPMWPMIMPMVQQLETTLRVGAVPQAPQFRPNSSPAQSSPPKANVTASTTSALNLSTRVASTAKAPARPLATKEEAATSDTGTETVKIAATSGSTKKMMVDEVSKDPLQEARGKVQEEICREFAAIMATGTLRASEAAALAARRVMERHGRLNVATPQS